VIKFLNDMQVYLSFIEELNILIDNASYYRKYRLALEICRRLYPEYQSFVNKKKFGDAELLLNAIEFCEKYFMSKETNNEILSELIEKTESIIPNTEDFSGWDVSYALNASLSVSELLKFTQDSKNKHISDICSLMIDTIDFKIAEENKTISDDGIYKHPLMIETMKELKDKIRVD
jgi:uncharacterized protein YjaG (DUF416 family)